MKRIAIFASGRGSNAIQIIDHLDTSDQHKVACILSNNPKSGIIQTARDIGMPYLTFDRDELYQCDVVLAFLQSKAIDYIVLAGFMWLFPDSLLTLYPNRVLNIHPSLLPKYGGKGMYGLHVHRAVLAHQESCSGITIHVVNQDYDKGRILLQTKVNLGHEDTAEMIAAKVLKLEHHFYPRVVAAYCR